MVGRDRRLDKGKLRLKYRMMQEMTHPGPEPVSLIIQGAWVLTMNPQPRGVLSRGGGP